MGNNGLCNTWWALACCLVVYSYLLTLGSRKSRIPSKGSSLSYMQYLVMVQWYGIGYPRTMACWEAAYADLTGLGYIILWNISSWQTDRISSQHIDTTTPRQHHDNDSRASISARNVLKCRLRLGLRHDNDTTPASAERFKPLLRLDSRPKSGSQKSI